MTKQFEFGFCFLVLKTTNDETLFLKPEDIKYIKPAIPSGFTVHLKDKSFHKVNHTQEELMDLLGKVSYKFVEPTKQTKTKKSK